MSPEPLQVTTSHLHELAAKQSQAAAELRSATETATAVGSAIRTSHGVIAWSTAGAVEALQDARRIAGDAVTDVAHALSENLTSAAERYEATDRTAGAALDQQLHLGPSASRPPR
ncbi:MAG: ESX-1 secretion-associated protein [Actinomycetia bacterium]|nr:ESX-1 secretion-associated protein [Actinomycetes bacterium]MCH9701399.1 ESX-1 secretion-associated protein [Actinomycetes bacterium]MCH9760883.1 ESX-1 secretion-associated protein [Actinomycetes bacterium]